MAAETAEQSGDRTVATVAKNSREELRIALTTWKGINLVSFRIWYDAGNGEHRPSKSGFAMRIATLPAIATAINQALEIARREGLLGP